MSARNLLLAACAASLLACSPSWKSTPHDRPFQRAAPPVLHPKPATNIDTDWWDHVLHSTVVPLSRMVSPARYIGWLIGGRGALDVNELGQVPDSTWYHNRISRAPMTVQELRRGATVRPGPADGPLTILSGKIGVTPGMVVRDRDGVIWFMKFDLPAFPEMTTGAEMIASRALHAAGYNVPEIHIMELELTRLELSDQAWTRDKYNRKIEFTAERLREYLLSLNPDIKGRLRALVSRAVPGEPIGSFAYRGRRADDPNDDLPHERRRSLRGLWVFQAWLNNHDTRKQNTLDTFIKTRGKLGYVRHYLLDFGDSLGATGAREKYASEGHEERVAWNEIGKRLACFGLCYPYWQKVRRSPYRSVGIFEAKVFDPARWAPMYPNPAFREATPRDTFWAASVLARFDDRSILAIVGAAKYSEAGALDWVYRVLRARRDKILRHAFRSMLALVDPRVEDEYRIELTDLEVLRGLVRPRDYTWRVRWNRDGGRDKILDRGVAVGQPEVDLRRAVTRGLERHGKSFARDPYITLSVWRPKVDGQGPRVDVHIRVVRDHLLVVGIDRTVQSW